MVFADNHALKTVEGLRSLTSISGNLSLNINRSFQQASGFRSLVSVGGFFVIHQCDFLETVDDFRALTSVGGGLSIWNNASLTELRGLHGLNSVGNYFDVTTNPELPACEAELLRDSIGVDNIGGEIDIRGNDGAGSCD